MTIDGVLNRIRAQMNLEAEREYELLEEIRTHLEEAVEEARAEGLDEHEALIQAAARFGVDRVAQELQDIHTGWGTLEGVAAAGLPVLCALVLRWLIFAPGGSAGGWRWSLLVARPQGEMVSHFAIWAVGVIVLLVPLLRFPRRRYALVSWAVFWALSVLIALGGAIRW